MPTLSILEAHLVDINSPENIPDEVMDFFWSYKEEKGGMALGIAYLPESGWYILSPALLDDFIVKHFA